MFYFLFHNESIGLIKLNVAIIIVMISQNKLVMFYTMIICCYSFLFNPLWYDVDV